MIINENIKGKSPEAVFLNTATFEMNIYGWFKQVVLALVLSCLMAGCGGTAGRYNNEFLINALELERGLKENPGAVNKLVIKARIRKLKDQHTRMLQLEREKQKADYLEREKQKTRHF